MTDSLVGRKVRTGAAIAEISPRRGDIGTVDGHARWLPGERIYSVVFPDGGRAWYWAAELEPIEEERHD